MEKVLKKVPEEYWVDHSERAKKQTNKSEAQVLTDGNTTEYFKIAFEYFGKRCAFTGEEFYTFGEKVEDRINHNLSAEHIVPFARGGEDIIFNIVPVVYQYNIQKKWIGVRIDIWTHFMRGCIIELCTPI